MERIAVLLLVVALVFVVAALLQKGFKKPSRKNMNILLMAGVILLVLWLLGMSTAYTLGGGIHVLLAIAIISIFIWFFMGRRRI